MQGNMQRILHRRVLHMADDTLTYIEGDLYAYHEDNPGNLAMPYMGVASGFFHRYINKGWMLYGR